MQRRKRVCFGVKKEVIDREVMESPAAESILQKKALEKKKKNEEEERKKGRKAGEREQRDEPRPSCDGAAEEKRKCNEFQCQGESVSERVSV